MILVTGATGTVGSSLVKQLVARRAAFRALVRNPERAIGIRGPAVEFVRGDMAAPQTLEPALEGVDRLFLLSSTEPRQVQLQGNVVEAALRQGVRHIVKLSFRWAHPDSPIAFARWHAQTEQQIEESGVAWTHLRPTLFMQSFLGHAANVRTEGTFGAPMGKGRVSMVDTRDVAAVAAAVLTETGHERKAYEITGPEALSFHDAAQIISEVAGKRVSYVDIPVDEARTAMRSMGVPEWQVEDHIILYAFLGQNKGASVVPTVEKVGKVKPHTFAQFAADHSLVFRP